MFPTQDTRAQQAAALAATKAQADQVLRAAKAKYASAPMGRGPMLPGAPPPPATDGRKVTYHGHSNTSFDDSVSRAAGAHPATKINGVVTTHHGTSSMTFNESITTAKQGGAPRQPERTIEYERASGTGGGGKGKKKAAKTKRDSCNPLVKKGDDVVKVVVHHGQTGKSFQDSIK